MTSSDFKHRRDIKSNRFKSYICIYTYIHVSSSTRLLWWVLSKTVHIDDLMQECSNSIANTPEVLQFCTKPLLLWTKEYVIRPLGACIYYLLVIWRHDEPRHNQPLHWAQSCGIFSPRNHSDVMFGVLDECHNVDQCKKSIYKYTQMICTNDT